MNEKTRPVTTSHEPKAIVRPQISLPGGVRQARVRHNTHTLPASRINAAGSSQEIWVA